MAQWLDSVPSKEAGWVTLVSGLLGVIAAVPGSPLLPDGGHAMTRRKPFPSLVITAGGSPPEDWALGLWAGSFTEHFQQLASSRWRVKGQRP